VSKRKTTWVIGLILVAVGAVVLFLSWFLFTGYGCADPWPGCHTTYAWQWGFIGTVIATVGIWLIAYSAHLKTREDRGAMPLFVSMTAFAVLAMIILVTVFNPLISPYDFIRDSDLDGYHDDIDDYPHDKSRHMVTWLQLDIAWENTSTNYTARIADVWVIIQGEELSTSILELGVNWLPHYMTAYDEKIGNLAEMNGQWVNGVKYVDNSPVGIFGTGDIFSFDVGVFEDHPSDVSIADDYGYVVAYFTVVD